MKNKMGFTLIELLAVIVILGIIMVIAIPEVMGYITKSRRDTLGNAADFFKDEVTLETSMSGNDSLNGNYTVNDGIIIEENPFTFNKKLSFDGTFTIDGENVSYTFHNRYGICVSKKMNSNKKEFGFYKGSSCIIEDDSVEDNSSFVFDSETGTLLGYRSYEYEVDVNACVDYIQNDQFFEAFLFEDMNKLGKFCNGEKVLLGDDDFSFYEDMDFYIFWWDSMSFPGGEEKFYTKLYDNSKDLIIPDKIYNEEVLTIFDGTFSNFGLTSVKLPNNLISIGERAFADNKLRNIEIPDSVTSIGVAAFNNNLFPDDIAFIASKDNPDALISYAGEKRSGVLIPNSFTVIGESAFENVNLLSVTIPNTVTSIGIRSFAINGLTDVVIPDSVVSLGRTAFFENNLTSVTIPNSITTIGDSVFSTNNLTSIVIPSNIKSIGDEAFEVNNLTSVTIPDTVTSIGKSAFYSNELTSIVIPSSISVIEDLAFSYNKLTSVTMPNTITTIGWGAFTFNNLTNVTVPSSVISIGSDAFFKSAYSNNTLSSVIYSGTTPHDWTNIINGYNYGTPFTTGVLTSNYGSNVTISAN